MTASSINTFINTPVALSREDSGPLNLVPQCAKESQWIEDAAGGDYDAFDQLVILHQDRIFQICLRLLNCREDAREAAQDVFVRAFKALPRYKAKGKFSTWLYQIALNRCRDSWKCAASKLFALSDPIHLCQSEPKCSQSPSPSASLAQQEELALIQKALLTLPRRDRELIILSCIDGLPHSECAQILKCSERAIEGRLYRARQKLRAALAH